MHCAQRCLGRCHRDGVRGSGLRPRETSGTQLRHTDLPATHQPAARTQTAELDLTAGVGTNDGLGKIGVAELECAEFTAALVHPERPLDVLPRPIITRRSKAYTDLLRPLGIRRLHMKAMSRGERVREQHIEIRRVELRRITLALHVAARRQLVCAETAERMHRGIGDGAHLLRAHKPPRCIE